MSILPDPVTIRCERCHRRGRYRRARFFEIAGTDEPTQARLTFAAVMGCKLAGAQIRDEYIPGFERCGIIYEGLAGRSDVTSLVPE